MGGLVAGEEPGRAGDVGVPPRPDGGEVVDVFGDGLVAGPGGAADAGLGVGVTEQVMQPVPPLPLRGLGAGRRVPVGCRRTLC